MSRVVSYTGTLGLLPYELCLIFREGTEWEPGPGLSVSSHPKDGVREVWAFKVLQNSLKGQRTSVQHDLIRLKASSLLSEGRDLSKRVLWNTCYWCFQMVVKLSGVCHIPSCQIGSPLHLRFTNDLVLILQSWDRWLRFLLALFCPREAWTYGPCHCVLGKQIGLIRYHRHLSRSQVLLFQTYPLPLRMFVGEKSWKQSLLGNV